MVKKFNQAKQRGFTLVELLIVIAILGILAAIIIATIDPVKRINQSKDARTKSDLGEIVQALQVYYTDSAANGGAATATYPPNLFSLTVSKALQQLPVPSGGGSYNSSYVVTGGTAAYLLWPIADTTSYGSDDNWCWSNTSGTIAPVNASSC